MRSLILSFFALALAICSCSSSRSSSKHTHDTASVAYDGLQIRKMDRDFSAVISSGRRFELSGVSIEFFAPDSNTPPSRASPHVVSIENIKLSESEDSQVKDVTSSEDKETVNLLNQSSSDSSEDKVSDVNTLHPSRRFLILALFILILTTIIKKKR